MASRTPLTHPASSMKSLQQHTSDAVLWRGKFLHSFVYAFAGILHAVRTQRNMRIHLLLASIAVVLGFIVRLSMNQWAILALAIMAVLVSEMFNTVVEAIVDMVSPEFHPLAKIAKDVAAGAVLITAIFAAIIGILLFGPHIFARLLTGLGR